MQKANPSSQPASDDRHTNRSSDAASAGKPEATQTEQPGTSQGMPAKTPRPQSDRTDHQPTLEDASVETSLELPHERDQASDMTADEPDPRIEQAARDVAKGIKDTSKGTELDATSRKLAE